MVGGAVTGGLVGRVVTAWVVPAEACVCLHSHAVQGLPWKGTWWSPLLELQMLGLVSSCGRMMDILITCGVPGVSVILHSLLSVPGREVVMEQPCPFVFGASRRPSVSLSRRCSMGPAGLFMLGDTLPQRIGNPA